MSFVSPYSITNEPSFSGLSGNPLSVRNSVQGLFQLIGNWSVRSFVGSDIGQESLISDAKESVAHFPYRECVTHQTFEKAKGNLIAAEFHVQANAWKAGTRAASSPARLYSHIAYKRIIELGEAEPYVVVPLILEELRNKPDVWFFALREITKEDPAVNEKTFAGAVSAWLNWGRRNYIG